MRGTFYNTSVHHGNGANTFRIRCKPSWFQYHSGGSIFVHTFGAYFGLAISFCLRKQRTEMSEEREGPRYTSDITSLLGRRANMQTSDV